MRIKLEKFFENNLGSLFGIIANIIGLTGFYLASLSIPGYNILENMISHLGGGQGGIYANLGLIISGILAMPFYLQLEHELKHLEEFSKIRKAAISSALTSCTFYSLVGVFPAIQSDLLIFYLHGTVSAIALFTGVGYLLLFSFLMEKSPEYSKIQAIHGVITAGLYTAVLFTWHPFIEWMAAFGVISWVLTNSAYILYKKRKKIR